MSELCLDAARRVCAAAAGGSLLAGSSVVEVRVRGVRAVLAVRLNVDEVERRTQEGVGPLLDLAVLNGLMQLPAGLPLLEASLSLKELRLLRRFPPGAVERSGSQLVRRLVPPLEVDVAVVRARRPVRAALLRAGRFGAYTRAAVWLDGPARESELLVMEAGVYGLGVVHGEGAAGPEVLVAPRSTRDFTHTAAGWLFHEQVYGQLLGASRGLLPTP